MPHVDEIEAMDRQQLLALWQDLFDVPPPKSLSRPFLRRVLAFEVQARAMGRLPKGFITKLERAAGEDAPKRPQQGADRGAAERAPYAGSRLLLLCAIGAPQGFGDQFRQSPRFAFTLGGRLIKTARQIFSCILAVCDRFGHPHDHRHCRVSHLDNLILKSLDLFFRRHGALSICIRVY